MCFVIDTLSTMDYSQRQALPLIELTPEDTGLKTSDARDGFHFIALAALERTTLPDIVSVNRPDKSPNPNVSQDIDQIVSKFVSTNQNYHLIA